MSSIQLISNPPWVGSGFGMQCALLARQLRNAGHKVLVEADTMPFGTVLTWEGIPVAPSYFPSALRTDMVGYYAERHESDVVLVLLDVFGMNAQPEHFKELKCPSAWWVPVDSMPLGATTGSRLKASGMTPLAMSRFGEMVLHKAGFERVLYVPHAVDTELFSPPPAVTRKQAREDRGIDPDTFVIGINAANQHPYRKNWFGQLYTFKVFHDQHPDSVLLAWTLPDGRPQGIALDAIVEMLGLQDCVQLRHPGDVSAGVATPRDLATGFYAACDLLSNCSWGEGFGVPILEAQSCGVPVVVTDFSAMPEVAAAGEFGGWRVPSTPELAPDEIAALYGRPHMPGIGAAYEQAFQERESGLLARRSEAARQHALAYDHERIFELHWQFILDELMSGAKAT